MTISKPALYDLIRTLHSEFKLPAAMIAELIGKSPRQVRRIIADLSIRKLTKAEHIKALPDKIVALCLVARRGKNVRKRALKS